jgi:DNA-binding beta-propeller fold protein YncE
MLFIICFSLLTTASCKKENGTSSSTVQCGTDGVMCIVAGKVGENGGTGNGGQASAATLYWPADLIINSKGEMLIVDFNNHCVRKIDASGVINDFIGSGYLGDSPKGSALSANPNHPTGIVQDANGDYWLAAWHNWKIKKILASDGTLSTLVGTSQGFSGDGGLASAAQLNLPSSIVFDQHNNLFFTDQANQRIRKVDLTTMVITTFVGSTKGFKDTVGTGAQFSLPLGTDAGPGGKLAISADGNWLYIADTENDRIRKINLSTAEVTTIAGTGAEGYSGDGGPAIAAQLNHPVDVVVAPDQTIYFSDSKNHIVRRINPSGVISTVAGTPGVSGASGDAVKATSAQLNNPGGLFLSADNTLYICDTYNGVIRKIKNP